jgi:pilus assembly protein CpaC
MKNWILALSLLGAARILPAAEQEVGELTLTLGGEVVVDCPDGISRVAVSAPEAVDIVTASNRELLFNGKGLGRATVVIWSKSGKRKTYDVTVEPNLEPMRRLLRETFPDDNIDVRASRDSMALVGRASSTAVAERALALVTASVKGAISNLEIAPPPVENQILLHVKFAELTRTADAEFGVNLLSTGAGNTIGQISTGLPSTAQLQNTLARNGGSQFNLADILNVFAFRPDLNLGAVIRDLQARGLLQILAEPNLVATSGKEASFLAGGEFPVPIIQGGANAGAITIQFREFGIRLSFTPQLTAQHTVRLHVKPEVSSLDAADGVTVSGFKIPALTTRRLENRYRTGRGTELRDWRSTR